MPKVEVEIGLSAEDRALLKDVRDRLAKTVKGDADIDDSDSESDETETETETDDEFESKEGEKPKVKATREDVRKALKAYADKTSSADAVKVMKSVGKSDSLSKLAEDKFDAVVAALAKKMK